MRSYEVARKVFSFMEFVAWAVVVIGGLVAMVTAGSVSKYAGGGAGLLAIIPGLAISLAGLFLVAFVQVGRANIDTAEYTQQMLKIARDQLEVSRQSLEKGHSNAPSFTAKNKEIEAGTSPSFSELRAAKNQPASSGAVQIEDQSGGTERALREDFKYHGQFVSALSDAYVFDGKDFQSREEVIAYIDNTDTSKPTGTTHRDRTIKVTPNQNLK